VQQILGHHSILTTARYTHLTNHTAEQCSERLNALMSRYRIGWSAATSPTPPKAAQPGAQP
jgi:hypothetical protein